MYKCLKVFVNGSCWLIGGDIENEAEDDIFTHYLFLFNNCDDGHVLEQIRQKNIISHGVLNRSTS